MKVSTLLLEVTSLILTGKRRNCYLVLFKERIFLLFLLLKTRIFCEYRKAIQLRFLQNFCFRNSWVYNNVTFFRFCYGYHTLFFRVFYIF